MDQFLRISMYHQALRVNNLYESIREQIFESDCIVPAMLGHFMAIWNQYFKYHFFIIYQNCIEGYEITMETLSFTRMSNH